MEIRLVEIVWISSHLKCIFGSIQILVYHHHFPWFRQADASEVVGKAAELLRREENMVKLQVVGQLGMDPATMKKKTYS